MGFLGIEFAAAAPYYRRKRFIAFLIDLILVIVLWFLAYQIVGKPDFFAVKEAMDAAEALPAESQQEAMTAVFQRFDEAFQFGLILWFAYEVLTTLLFNGRTPGKLLVGLQIVPMNPGRNRVLHCALLIVRSAVKMLSMYLLQGFPFIICALTVLTNSDRSGFDMFVKTRVAEKKPDLGTGKKP